MLKDKKNGFYTLKEKYNFPSNQYYIHITLRTYHTLVSIMKKSLILISICLCISETRANPSGSKIKVCVIGAGPAGISTTRNLARHSSNFDITVFERAYEVGGQWLYTDKTGIDDDGYSVHSSIYKYMITNNLKELMVYPDWQVYKDSNKSFVHHSVILDYLKNYVDHFQLRQYIQFNSIVLNVSLLMTGGQEKWEVTVKNSKTSEISKSVFDAVIINSGHFSVPRIPKIPGLEDFKGMVLHSHSYRTPEMFKNKSVIILGSGFSGRDIGLQLLNFSSKIYLSHNKEKLNIRGLIQVKGIDKFENGSFVLKDNTTISADVLLLCTGYWYSFPFLDSNTGIKIDDDDYHVHPYPLYKQIFNVEHPSMAFIGMVNVRTSLLPHYSVQVQYMIAVLEGKVKLPSKSEMLIDAEINKSKHYTYEEIWQYLDDLATTGGFSINETIWYRDIIKFVRPQAMLLPYNDYRAFRLVISHDKKSFKLAKI